jgi:hypothetical protein
VKTSLGISLVLYSIGTTESRPRECHVRPSRFHDRYSLLFPLLVDYSASETYTYQVHTQTDTDTDTDTHWNILPPFGPNPFRFLFLSAYVALSDPSIAFRFSASREQSVLSNSLIVLVHPAHPIELGFGRTFLISSFLAASSSCRLQFTKIPCQPSRQPNLPRVDAHTLHIPNILSTKPTEPPGTFPEEATSLLELSASHFKIHHQGSPPARAALGLRDSNGFYPAERPRRTRSSM